MTTWLVLLTILTLVGVGVPVVHAHGAGTPGIYNEECSLERLATGPGTAALAPGPVVHALPDLPAPPEAVVTAAPAAPSLVLGARGSPLAS